MSEESKEDIKFLILGDLHGNIPNIHFKEFDAIISPGDICGGEISTYIYNYSENEKEIKYIEKIIEKSKISKEELNYINYKNGEKVLNYLTKFNKPIFLVPGNWDFSPHCDGIQNETSFKNIKNPFETLLNKFPLVKNLEYKTYNFNGITIIGYGSTSAPEILDKNEILTEKNKKKRKELEKRYFYFQNIYNYLLKIFDNSKNPIIYISHNTPYGTSLDIINSPKNPLNGKNYGSILSRKIIEKYSPLLCISGHIHEGKGEIKKNSTTIINSGYGYDVNLLITINKNSKEIISIEKKGKNLRERV